MVSSNASADAIKRLSVRGNRYALLHFSAHIALVIVSGILVGLARGSLWLWPAMLLHGTGLVFLFCPLHETIHRTAFASRWLNLAVSRLCGALLILPPRLFRAFHFAHHRFTQIPGADPELQLKTVDHWRGYLLYLSGALYWYYALRGLIAAAAGKTDAPYIDARQRPGIIAEARLYLLFYAILAALSYALSSNAILFLWLIPVVLAQPLLRAYLLAEHSGCALNSNMLENSRTTASNTWLRFLAWNMPYHVEHHLYPGVPFHALPALHRLIDDNIVHASAGYVAFHRGWIKRLGTSKTVEHP